MMSRVHKYRAWDGNKMLYPGAPKYIAIGATSWGYWNEDNLLADSSNKEHQLMEFTGLLDKNGNEIYEGDIIKIESIVYYSDSSKKVYRNGKLIWNQNKSRFEVFLSKKHYNTFIWAVNEQSEVIGNIFENPEYLEE